MNEGKPKARDNMLNTLFDRWQGYPRTKTDVWIDGAAIFFCLCGGLFLIIALSTLLPVFLGLLVGSWFIAWILWLWRTFRRMLWKAQKHEHPGSPPASTVRRVLVGLGFLLAGILWGSGFSSLHQEWSYVLAIGGTGLILGGVVEIVQAVKQQNTSKSKQ